MKKHKGLEELFKLADEIFDFIVQKCAVDGQVDFDELDIVIDRLKLLKDRLIAFETHQRFTIDEIQKVLKELRKDNQSYVKYID